MLKHFCLACCTLICLAGNSRAAIRFELPQIEIFVGSNQSASGYIDVVVRAETGDLPQSVGSFNVDFKTTSASLSFGVPQTASNPLFSGTPQNFSPSAQISRAARDIFPSSAALMDNAGLVRVPFQTVVGVTGSFPLMFGSFNELTNASAMPLSLQTTDVGSITVTLAPPGDHNYNGVVDAADYVLWRMNDNNQPGYDLWRAHFGQTAGSGAGANLHLAVPEPGILSLVLVAACGFAWRRWLPFHIMPLRGACGR